MKPTLVVLAAGMGSRYGGLKQVDPVGPSGEAILDYSVFDAIRGGFGKIVFIIRKDIEAEFKEKIGSKYAGHVDIDYCFQDMNDLPAGFSVPEGRTKPWGTAHAVRAARDVVKTPFAVINADDFYGRDAMAKLGAFLGSDSVGLGSDSVEAKTQNDSGSTLNDAKLSFAMVGYRLDLTLSENGSVARGICETDAAGNLVGVTERTKLVKSGDHAHDEESNLDFPLDSRVSMNCWGFSLGLFEELEKRFVKFLAERGTEMKSEWYIPFVVDELIKEGKASCRMLPTDSSWFGVTYREDKPFVVGEIAKLVAQGEYPQKLF